MIRIKLINNPTNSTMTFLPKSNILVRLDDENCFELEDKVAKALLRKHPDKFSDTGDVIVKETVKAPVAEKVLPKVAPTVVKE